MKKHLIKYRSGVSLLAAALTIFTAPFSPALAIDKIDSPYVEKGELDIEYSGSRSFDRGAAKDNLQDTEALLAYAPTDRWEADLGGYFSKMPDESFTADGLLLENIFQFTKKGSAFVDSGVLLAWNGSTHANLPGAVEAKLLLEKDAGKFVNIVNLGLAEEVGAHAERGPDCSFQWNTQYTLREEFSPGFEIQTDFGRPSEGWSFNRGQQYMGPGIYGMVLEHFHYEAAWLAGVSSGASNGAVRFLFQYQMHL